ncbi:hypothetical protein [Atlantibacter hermannii]|uniref:hypothetical protein n=1 Tax=Atlantibacter hermannii TaxID=565 RepID=UPI002FE2B1D9
MALTLLAANNAQTVLAAGISSSATSITVNTGTGALFPAPVSGTSYFKLTLVDSATGSLSEIVHVTDRAGDVMTIQRAQEGTVARAWSANDLVANMMTAGSFALLLQKQNNLSDLENPATGRTNLGFDALGIGVTAITSLTSFDWQQADLISSAVYLVSSTNVINMPPEISYTAGTGLFIRVEGSTAAGRMAVRLIPDTTTNSNFNVYIVTITGAKGSRVFTVRKEFNNANVIGTGNGGTGATTPEGAIQNLLIRENLSGIVGDTRNARMNVTAASATATFTADSVIVEDSSGRQYRVKAFSANINLAISGAGGMDTGTVPTTGFIALYAIYNPTNGNKALLAVNATSAAVPEIYGGANMPSGYTASALVSVWPVATSKFIIGFQQGRKLGVQLVSTMTTTTTTSGYQPFSIASIIPLNAKAWSGAINISGTASVVGTISADSGGIDAARVTSTGAGGTAVATCSPFRNVSIITSQTAYYFFTAGGSPALNVYFSGYIF